MKQYILTSKVLRTRALSGVTVYESTKGSPLELCIVIRMLKSDEYISPANSANACKAIIVSCKRGEIVFNSYLLT